MGETIGGLEWKLKQSEEVNAVLKSKIESLEKSGGKRISLI